MDRQVRRQELPGHRRSDVGRSVVTQVDERTLTFANSLAGKVTLTGRIAVSADGMTRTVTVSGADSAGKKVTSTSVFDKQ